MSPETKYSLKLSSYNELNREAVCRILVDPERKDIGRLSKMFVTVIVTRTSKSQDLMVPINLRKPPRPTKLTKGRSKLWADFRYQGLGDSLNAPQFGDSVPEGGSSVQQSQSKINIERPTALVAGALAGKHRFLTWEKASFVGNWAAEVEAGAVRPNVTEPNGMPPPNPATEPALPILPPGIKRRKAIIMGTEDGISEPIGLSKPLLSTETSRIEHGKSITKEDYASQRAPRLPANFNSSTEDSCQRKSRRPKPIEQELTQLIDLNDTSTSSGPNTHSISYHQVPLVPIKARIGLTTEENHSEQPKGNGNRCRLGPAEVPLAGNNPRIREAEYRVFHRTMGQKTGNNSRTGKDRKNKVESEDNILNTSVVPSMISKASTPCSSNLSSKSLQLSEWKKARQADEDEKRAVTLNDFLQHISRVLNGVRCFPGTISLEIQFGLILASRSLIEECKEVIFDTKTWNRHFQPKNNLPTPSTIFTNMLTTSGADVDFVLDLPESQGDFSCRMFSEEVVSRHVWYEFHCTTKNDETFVVSIDESGTAVVNRPEYVLGTVNVHCAAQTWDMRGVVKGTVEYIRGDEEIDQAIQNLIDQLYIEPDLSRIVIFTRIPEGGQFHIIKVLTKRSTRHRFHRHETRSLRISTKRKAIIHDQTPAIFTDQCCESFGSSNGQEMPLGTQEPLLQIIEVQNLLLAHFGDDNTVVRARAISADNMVDDHRLWYEMSVINPTIEEILRSNKYLDFGDTNISWSTFKPPVKNEKRSASDTNTAKSSEIHPAVLNPPELPIAEISSKDVSELFQAANRIVEKIDGVGWANSGPEAQAVLKINQALSASVAARSMATAEVPDGYW